MHTENHINSVCFEVLCKKTLIILSGSPGDLPIIAENVALF